MAKQAIGTRALTIVRKYFPNVQKVNDGPTSLDIEVTPKDVATSARQNHKECAMAVACKRAQKLDGILVSVRTAYLIKGNVATRYQIPEAAAREIVAFDRGGNFSPGSYKLRKPERLLGNPHGSVKPGNGKGKPVVRHHLTANIRSVIGSDKVR